MLREIRQSGKSLFTQLLLGLLALMFVFWGIGDMFRMNLGHQKLASIDGAAVSPQEFQQELHQRMEYYRQTLGEQYSPEMMRRLGLPQQVLQDLINKQLVQKEAQSLGIRVPDDAVLAEMSHTDAFKQSGKFSKEMFSAALQNAGLSEQRYIDETKKAKSTQLLVGAFPGGLLVSDTLAAQLYALRQEKRLADLYVLDEGYKLDLPAPSAEQLAAFYKSHAASFQQPETRRVEYIHLTPSTATPAAVNEEQIQELYSKRSQALRSPESRLVSQLLYADEASAARARLAYLSNHSLEATAKAYKPDNRETDLGYLTADQLPQQARAEVFALKQGDITQPVKSDFGWHLFTVRGVRQSVLPPLDAVRDKLTKEILANARAEEIYAQATKIEDLLSDGGASLADVAKEYNLPLEKSPAFYADGTTVEKGATLPPIPLLASRTYKLAAGDNSGLIDAKEKGYYVFTVAEINPAKLPSIDEVKEPLSKAYQAGEREKKLLVEGKALAKALSSGGALQPFLQKGLKIRPNLTLGYNQDTLPGTPPVPLPEPLRGNLFSLAPGQAGEAFTLAPGMVAVPKMIKGIAQPQDEKTRPAGIAALKSELQQQYDQDMLQGYLTYLQQKYPVTVNNQLLETLSK